MSHDAKTIVERELSQLDWSSGHSKQAIVDHFRMAPTIREMLEHDLPDQTYKAASDVNHAIPGSSWQRVEQTIQEGTPESHYLRSRAAQFNDFGQTPGWGRPEEQQPPSGNAGADGASA